MRYALGIALMVMAFACRSDKSDKPEVIPKDDFVDLLVDMYLADAMVSYGISEDYNDWKDNFRYYKGALDKHGYTMDEFKESYDFYSHDMNTFEGIINEVLARVNRLNGPESQE